jgi:tripartite-type tricarboxylate transporter receptor subunit TctC
MPKANGIPASIKMQSPDSHRELVCEPIRDGYRGVFRAIRLAPHFKENAMKRMVQLSAFMFALFLATSWAGEFPNGPVTAIVPFGPGGGTDRSVRVMSVAWEKITGKQMRVVNMPGAGSATGMRFVLKSRPDGYTIVQNGNQMSTLPYFFSKEEIGWELKDFQPIASQQLISMLVNVRWSPHLTAGKKIPAAHKPRDFSV